MSVVAENGLFGEPLDHIQLRLILCKRRIQFPDHQIRVIPRHVIWYMLKGHSRVRMDDEIFELAAGDLLIFRPGVQLAGVWPASSDLPIHVTINYSAKLPDGRELLSVAPVATKPEVTDRERVHAAVTKLERAAGDRLPSSQLTAIAALAELLSALIETLPQRSPAANTHPFVSAAIRYIHEHAHTPMTVEAMCAKCGLSSSYLRELFSQQIGMSPHQYLQRVRFFKASELLVDQKNSIADIAFELGFSSPNYFSRWFRKQAGRTPSQYRQQFVL